MRGHGAKVVDGVGFGIAASVLITGEGIQDIRARRPAVAVDDDRLTSSVRSARNRVVHRHQVVRIGPIVTVGDDGVGDEFANALARRGIGHRCVEVVLDRGVLPAYVDTRIGDATVEGDLDEVRDALVDWLDGWDEWRADSGVSQS
jgi:hypothetical protein